MRYKSIKKKAAVLLAVMIVNCAVNAPLSGKTLFDSFIVNAAESGCFFDEDTSTLILKGSISQREVYDALKKYKEEKIVAEDGTVFSGYCNSMFMHSTANSIDLSKVDTSGVTDMSSMFNSCSDLVTLDISGFDTSNTIKHIQAKQRKQSHKQIQINSMPKKQKPC